MPERTLTTAAPDPGTVHQPLVPAALARGVPSTKYRVLVPVMTGAAVAAALGSIGVALWAYRAVQSYQQPWVAYGGLMSGTAAPLLSFAALALVFVGFLLQQRQLEAYEYELRSGGIHQNRDTFERSFFELLRFHRESATGMLARPRDPAQQTETGLPAFAAAADEIDARLATVAGQPGSPLPAIATAFQAVCLGPQSNFGHYFRTLFYLLNTIDRDAPANRKRYYAQVVRAQLSASELRVLFYNGLSEDGQKSFRELIERYGLLKGLRLGEPLRALEREYRDGAFRDTPDR